MPLEAAAAIFSPLAALHARRAQQRQRRRPSEEDRRDPQAHRRDRGRAAGAGVLRRAGQRPRPPRLPAGLYLRVSAADPLYSLRLPAIAAMSLASADVIATA